MRRLAVALSAMLTFACGDPEPVVREADAAACNVVLLPPLPGDAASRANALSGDVVVGASAPGVAWASAQPVIWQMRDPDKAGEEWHCDATQERGDRSPCVRSLPPLDPDDPTGEAHDISPGRVVGTSGDRPVVWSLGPDAMPAVAAVPGTARRGAAAGLSGTGVVVGWARTASATVEAPEERLPVPDRDPTPLPLRSRGGWAGEIDPGGLLDLEAGLGVTHPPPEGGSHRPAPTGFVQHGAADALASGAALHAVADVAGDVYAVGVQTPAAAAPLAVVADRDGVARIALGAGSAFDVTPAPARSSGLRAEPPEGAPSRPEVGSEDAPFGRLVVAGEQAGRPVLWMLDPDRIGRFGAGVPPALRLGLGGGGPAPRGAVHAVAVRDGVVHAAGSFEHPVLAEPRALVWNEEDGGADLDASLWPGCDATLVRAADLDADGRVAGEAKTSAGARAFLHLPGTRRSYERLGVSLVASDVVEGATPPVPGDRVRLTFEITNPYAALLWTELTAYVPSGLEPAAPAQLTGTPGAPGQCARERWGIAADPAAGGAVATARVRAMPEDACTVSLDAVVSRWGPEPVVHDRYELRIGDERIAGAPALAVALAPRPPEASKTVHAAGPWRRWRFAYALDPGALPEPSGRVFERLPDTVSLLASAPPAGAPVPGLDCAGADAWADPEGDGELQARAVVVGSRAFACDLLVEATGSPWLAGETRSLTSADYGLHIAGRTAVGDPVTWDVTRPVGLPPEITSVEAPGACDEIAPGELVPFTIEAFDPDGDALARVSLRDAGVTAAELTPGSGAALGTFALEASFAAGERCVELVVEDDGGSSSRATHCLSVGGPFPRYDATWLAPEPGAGASLALTINAHGTVGGASDDDGCLWDAAGTIACFDGVRGRGPVVDVNASGDYVGYGASGHSFAVQGCSVWTSDVPFTNQALAIDDGGRLLNLLPFTAHSGSGGFLVRSPGALACEPERLLGAPVIDLVAAPTSAAWQQHSDAQSIDGQGRGIGVVSAAFCRGLDDPLGPRIDHADGWVYGIATDMSCGRYGVLIETSEIYLNDRGLVDDFALPRTWITHPDPPIGNRDPGEAVELATGLPLPLPSGATASAAWAANASGHIVGTIDDAAGRQAARWDRCDDVQHLEDLVDDSGCAGDSSLREARAINDRGQIAGFGTCDGQDRAFRLDPR